MRSEPTLGGQREFWNRWNLSARSPANLNSWTILRGEAILRALDSLRLAAPRILDLGCGTGWLTEQLAARGSATGVDLSDTAIAAARARCPAIDYIAGDLFEMRLPEGYFDVAVSQDVLAHVSDQPGYLAIAARVLKPGGYLIATTTNRFVVTRMGLPPQPPEHIERWLDVRSFRRLLRKHFEIRGIRTLMPVGTGGVLRLVNSPRLEWIVRPLMSPEQLVAVKERLGLGYNIVAVARRPG